MATYWPSWNLSKLDEPDMQDTAGEVGMNSSDVLLWTPSHACTKAGWPVRTFIQQLYANMECSPEDLPGAMDVREGWRERVGDIHADKISLICTQLNGFKYCDVTLAIQFNMSHLLAHSKMVIILFSNVLKLIS